MTSQSNASISLFAARSNIQIHDGSFVQYNYITKPEVLNPLYDKVSPNAILNKGGRADTVRCFPGTREEVIARIEEWHRANQLEGHPIFWLSGPAGVGKSAIVQTIAERCIERKIPMVNFFFFRADATRNDSGPVVATLLFQLFDLFPALKAHVTDIIANNPVIFRQSMQDQFTTLIEKPLRTIQPNPEQGPIVMLIDGLDECSSEHRKAEQTTLLHVLHNAATKVNPTFIVLVASRTEAHLTMAFNEIGASPASIYLDESYRPSDDIRLFLSGEFSRIRQTHNLRQTLDTNWPLPADFDSILDRSSGQFIYAATVIRFIVTSSSSPRRGLEIVLGLRPVTKTSPFATLDSLYTYILSRADDWTSVQDILAADKMASIYESFPSLNGVLSPLGYTNDDILSALSDLTAIVQFTPGNVTLTVFHASLDDFLYDPSRAGSFYIDINEFACRLAPLFFKQATTLWGLISCFENLQSITKSNDSLDELLLSYVPDPEIVLMNDDLYVYLKESCMEALENLYQSRDPLRYENVRNHWQEWFDIAENATQKRRQIVLP